MTTDLVLVVDDSPQNLLVATRHLETAGFGVATADSGERALAYLADNRPDLVVLDVLMPGIGGFETCRRMRATPAIADIPILFLTALGDRDATVPALDAGGDDLIAKPFARSELLLRVRALIRQHRAMRTRRETERQRIRSALERLRAVSTELDPSVAQRVLTEIELVDRIL